jgi:thiamine biosynthesis lipoprotein
VPLCSATFEAIGVANTVVVDSEDALETALAIARSEVDALDRSCSRFRDDSEVGSVNREAGSDVHVGPLLLAVVEEALRVAAVTGGRVDPTVGPALRALGYDRDFRLIARRGPPGFTYVPAVGWRAVRIDRRRSTLRIPRGSTLDLGAIAKAFAADRIASRVHAATCAKALVGLGGDISVADAPPGGWPVVVTDDHRREDGRGQTVGISHGGLATSSTTVRRWRAGDRDMHHIVDPTTGQPAVDHWRTVSVAAATCVDANAAATAAIVMGVAAPVWLERQGLAARLVGSDGAVTMTCGWPAPA